MCVYYVWREGVLPLLDYFAHYDDVIARVEPIDQVTLQLTPKNSFINKMT